MDDTGRTRLARKAGVILSLWTGSFIAGYFSLQLTVGSAPVFDPRDILVICGGVLAGPVGGGLVGLSAGLAGQEPAVFVPFYTLGGILTGLFAGFLRREKRWIPGAALGLGACYPLAGLLMMGMGLGDRIAALAFQALVMQFTCILVLSIIGSLDPDIFSWDDDPEKSPRDSSS
ncbi:MAG: LytS/YhcK type 5TM receptor domain-containing protein [Methanolinea sp.]|nr:LytS/YhcK type 5TM receptor domain-containing protein [Methanolinea sp.]